MKPYLYTIARFILKPIVWFLYKPEVIGSKNILKGKPIILAGNHTGYLDAFALGYTTRRDLLYIVKKELHEGPFKIIFKLVGTIPVDRKNKGNKGSLAKAEEALKNNQIIVIFPEGTINKTDDIIMPFKYGAVSLAKKSGAYIVPFAIKGKFKIFKRTVTIKLGEPYKVNDDLDKENKKLEQKVIKLLKED